MSDFPAFITDTMALVLFLEKRKLPPQVKNIFIAAERGQSSVFIPAMVCAEIGYLSEKKRIDLTINDLINYIGYNQSAKVSDTTFNIIQKAFSITDIPELHDRLIADTSLELNLQLITNDPVIRNSKYVVTIWD